MATKRERLYKEYTDLLARGVSVEQAHSALADKWHITKSAVRGTLSKARNSVQVDAPAVKPKPKQPGEIIYLNKSDIEPEPQPVSLADLNDRERWRAALLPLVSRKPFVRVMHLCDLHEPFSDPDVKEAAFALVELVQPDIIVRGSDEDDNPTISAWAEDGAEEPEIDDFLDTMQMTRNYNTRRLKKIAPNALQVNIEGNHGYPRFIKWINKKAPQSKTSLLRRYIENVRCNGNVFFIGFKSSVKIHADLVVMHGRKWGTTAAKQTLELRANSVSISAGHSHKKQQYVVVGKKVVICNISGCLCLIPAHHNADEDDEYCTWQHSTVVMTLNTETGDVDMKDVSFFKTDDSVWFEYGGQIYMYKIQQPAVTLAA